MLDWTPDSFQKRYLNQIASNSVVFVDAPSGTGKTTLAVYSALNHLSKGKVSKILYLRFPDDRSLRLGFLPGTAEEKAQKLFYPLWDALTECNISPAEVRELQQQDQLQATTDLFLRGTNLKSTFVIVDEAQNARSLDDLHLVLTRLHDTSKAVILGHSRQHDNRSPSTTFTAYMNHMAKKPWCSIAQLKNNYRGEISQWADAIFTEGGD